MRKLVFTDGGGTFIRIKIGGYGLLEVGLAMCGSAGARINSESRASPR